MVQKVLPKGPRVLPPKCDFQKMRSGECSVHILRGPWIVIGLGKNLLFKSVLGHCDMKSYEIQRTENFLPPGDTRLGFFLCQVQSNRSSFRDFLYGTGKTEM